jgi:CarD family transcriptional regulator
MRTVLFLNIGVNTGVRSPDSRLWKDRFYLNLESGDLTPCETIGIVCLTLLSFLSIIKQSKMDSFKIGDKIIYPNQGLGIIIDIQEEDYYGERFKIYHLRLLANNTLVLVPSTSTEEIGIRKPISPKLVEDMFDFMRNGTVEVTMNWKGRYKENLSLMKSGLMRNVAFVLKRLYFLNLIKPLSFREKKMMEKAKELIVSEIAEVSSSSLSMIEQKVLDNLSYCFRDTKPDIES